MALRIAAPAVAPYREAPGSIGGNATSLNRRIDELMALARSADGRLSYADGEVDLDRVAAAAMREIASLARSNGVAVRFEPAASGLAVRGDPVG